MLNRYWNHLWSEMSETGRKTFPWDVTRGAAVGTTATLQMTFALIIAIQYFEASTLQKSLIAGAFSGGLLLSPFYTSWSPILSGRRSAQHCPPSLPPSSDCRIASAMLSRW